VIEGGDGTPPEPNWKDIYRDAEKEARAHQYWSEVCSALRDAGGLTVSNGHAIYRLAAFRIEFDNSARDVADRGVIRPATKKRFEHVNPHFTAMRQLDETIRQLEAELGVSPARRARIGKVPRKASKLSPADRYLRPADRWHAEHRGD
jgi:phage terminase small subunit